jgi:ATP-dependent Lon protease
MIDDTKGSKKGPKHTITKLAENILAGKKVIFDKTAKENSTDIEQSIESAPTSNTTIPEVIEPTSSETAPALVPANQLVVPIVPLREIVTFPHTESVLTFGRSISVNAIRAANKVGGLVVLVAQRKPDLDKPSPADLYEVGTLVNVDRTLKTDAQINTLVSGVSRVKIIRYIRTSPYLLAQVVKLPDVLEKDEELVAMSTHLQKEFRRAVQMGKAVEFLNFMKLMSGVNEGELTDQIASTLTAKTGEKQLVLEELNVKKRMQLVIERLSHEMKVLEIEKDVASKTQAKFDKYMRENVLRERLKTIQKELGELDDEEELANEYDKQYKLLKAPIVKKLKNCANYHPTTQKRVTFAHGWIRCLNCPGVSTVKAMLI